jgi:hypothetical protein
MKKIEVLTPHCSAVIVQLAYNNWYWPLWALRDLNTDIFSFFAEGFVACKQRIRTLMNY